MLSGPTACDEDTNLTLIANRIPGPKPPLPGSGFTRDPPAPLTTITVEEFVYAQFLAPFCQKVRARSTEGARPRSRMT